MNLSLRHTALYLLMSLLIACGNSQSAPQTPPSVAVTTVKAEQREFHHSVYAWGEATADSRALVHLNMAHGGLISALPVAKGQSVKTGDVLLRMTTDPAARRGYQQAQNALTLARSDLGRIQRLVAQRLATQAQLAAARKSVADAKAAMQAERALGTTRDTQTLHSPADGVIIAVQVGLGDRVAANTPLLDFSPTNALVARLGVQPDQADVLKPGMLVQLKAVYGDQDAATGHVDMVGRAVDAISRMVPVRVAIPPDLGAHLIAGGALEGNIQTANFKAWAVPRDAVLKDSKGNYLFQVVNGKAKRIAVKVEEPNGAIVGVSGNIQPDLAIIVMGAYELSDGDAIREMKESRHASGRMAQ